MSASKNRGRKKKPLKPMLKRLHPAVLASITLMALFVTLVFSFVSIHTDKTRPLADEAQFYRTLYERDTKIQFHPYNPYNDAKYELGKMLFFDPRFSKSGLMSCSTCHNPALSWTDALPRVVGRTEAHPLAIPPSRMRKTMSLYNLAWDKGYTWDTTLGTLEEQSMMALMTEQGMALNPKKFEEKLAEVKGYRPYFEQAFDLKPEQPIEFKHFHQAVAIFERFIISDKAPFDYWVEGDEDAISEKAKEGFVIFNTKGKCSSCHTGWRFSDGKVYNIGLGEEDLGAGLSAPEDASKKFAFKAVGLRNIAIRPPYMHDGRFKTLEEVIDFYDRGGDVKSQNIAIVPLQLTSEEKSLLIEFLRTLTSQEEKPMSAPRLPR